MRKIIATAFVLLLGAGGLAWLSSGSPEWREPEQIACYSTTPSEDGAEITRQCRTILGIPAAGPDPAQSRAVQVRQRLSQLECALECSRITLAARSRAQQPR